MMTISLIVNVLVLVPVLAGLLSGRAGMDAAFGPDLPARRILIAVYLAIAILSGGLLFAPPDLRGALVPGLLVVQVVYKLLTVPLLRVAHPVVVTNLAVVAVHAVTLVALARG